MDNCGISFGNNFNCPLCGHHHYPFFIVNFPLGSIRCPSNPNLQHNGRRLLRRPLGAYGIVGAAFKGFIGAKVEMACL